MKSALIIGEALIDGVVQPDESIIEHPGGSPANVAIGLARLGRSIDLATWFSTDPHGAQLRTHFKLANVRVVPGSDRASVTSTAVATLDDQGQATYDFTLEWETPEVHLDSSVGLVHTGSIATTLEPGADAVVEVIRAAKEHSTISYDPNLRPTIMGTPEAVSQRVETLVGLSDVVKVSDEDLRWLYPDLAEEEVARSWSQKGPLVVVLTKGAGGAHGFSASGFDIDVPAPIVEVVDTVGAGDSFTSGLLDALWEGGLLGASNRTDLAGIDEPALRSTIEWAAQCAAITVSRAGANPPTRREVTENF